MSSAEILAPEINPNTVLTRTRGSRLHKPFCVKNCRDLDAKVAEPCPRCGYTGPAIDIRQLDGSRSVTTLVYSSRASFLRALASSIFLCANCMIEVHGRVDRKQKKRVMTWGISLANTLAAIDE